MKNWLVCLFFIPTFLSFSVFSQTKKTKKNIDSLYQVEKVKPNTIEKVHQLIYLYKTSIKQHKIRKDIIDEAIVVSENIFYIKGIGIGYNRKGITARYEQNYSQSVMYHKRALSYLEQTTDTLDITKCLNSLGSTYRKLNLETEAFQSHFRALKLAEARHDKKGMTIALNGVGNVFLNTEQYDRALRYFKKALEIKPQKKGYNEYNEYGLANIGEAFLGAKQYDSAYYYFDKALVLSVKNKKRVSPFIKHTLLGLLYQKKGEYQKSISYYNKAIPGLIKYKNTRYLSKALINIGINQVKLKRYSEGKKNITKGLEKAKLIKSKENISLGYQALVAYYSQTKNYKEALIAHNNAKIYHDSIINITSQRSMINMQVAQETEKKDQQIKKLALEKKQSKEKADSIFKRFVMVAIFSLFSIALIAVLFFLYRKNTDLELQQKKDEIHNYILKISELKDRNNDRTSEDILHKFKEFDLSKREIEVLKHISNGLKNEEISKQMFVSNNTIKTHITHIYSKLDVKNRIQAVQKIQKG